MGTTQLPDDVTAVAASLRDGLERVLGDALASLFLYGAVAFPRPAGWAIDFDFHVLLHRRLADAEHAGIDDLYRTLAAASALGADLDGYFVLLSDARRSEPPVHQLKPWMRDEAWALHRAHVHAGRYVVVCGLDPRPVVPEPTWAELAASLRAELAFIDSHPDATAFGILNGARILASFETRDVVMSKYDAGRWALTTLPPEWHDAVRAAMRQYEGVATNAERVAVDAGWASFVAFVKSAIPAT